MAHISGVSPDAPPEQNAAGGLQSKTGRRMDLMPAQALLRVAEVLDYGAKKYAPNNWRKIEVDSHINHALIHLYAFLAGDTSDDHLGHAACRAMMGLEMHLAQPVAQVSNLCGDRPKRVYIAGPITKGDLAKNINQATAAFVELAQAGFAPFCPQWSVYSSEPSFACAGNNSVLSYGRANGAPGMKHADWLRIDLLWVEASDAVLRLPGESKGADMEVSHAIDKKIPIFLTIQDLKEAFGVA